MDDTCNRGEKDEGTENFDGTTEEEKNWKTET
jgi:hypothetical protein